MFCPNQMDYSPCHCSDLEFHCWNVSVDEISHLFKQKTMQKTSLYELEVFNLTAKATDDILFIPVNILGDMFAATIEISCSVFHRPHRRIQIHRNAFRLSENITRVIKIAACNLSLLEMMFLKGFHKLETFAIDSATNVHAVNWTTLPSLPSLKNFDIKNSKGLNQWKQYPHLVTGLEEFRLINCNIDDIATNRTLHWLLNSSPHLRLVDLNSNKLTNIPTQLSFFRYIQYIYLDFNPLIKIIHKGALFSLKHLQIISFESCGIFTVEPDAFQGF